MAIITLTTDLGTQDFYLAALKGRILTEMPAANIIDISHQIPSFNILQCAFILKNAYKFFPKNTVHLIGINTIYEEENRYVALKYQDQYFVGTDTGIFSLLFEGKPDEVVEINIMQNLNFLYFPLIDIFVKAAVHIAKGGILKEIGLPLDGIKPAAVIEPAITGDSLKGTVIYIDKFQNCITNITHELFTKVQKGRNFTIFFKRNETINQLRWHYNEVEEGEKLCLFGLSNHLEIAINQGHAAQLLGLKIGESVYIEFHK